MLAQFPRFRIDMARSPDAALAPTFAQILDAAAGRTTGFDYLRLVLSIGVVWVHSFDIVYGLAYTDQFYTGLMRVPAAVLVPAFFALSGFLVAGSLARSASWFGFMGLRFLRLVPAIALQTVLAALLLGPLMTTLPIADYFRAAEFWTYFKNLIWDIQYRLPGVFAGNPWPNAVNAQLWTQPYELGAYMLLCVCAVMGLCRYRAIFASAVLLASLLLWWHDFNTANWSQHAVVPGAALIVNFLSGVALYLYRDRVVHSAKLAAGAALLATLCLIQPHTDHLAAVFVAYTTVYLGLLRPRASAFMARGDYSYGIFLYGFPVQQMLVHTLDPIGPAWLFNTLLALPITVGFAMLSWHGVEKPAMRLRTPLQHAEQALISWVRPLFPPTPITAR
jgi:peptidoglycan/LPS O-acetylase OafA/YrhL